MISLGLPLDNVLDITFKTDANIFLGRLLAILMEQQVDSLIHLSRTLFNRKLIYGSTYVFQWNTSQTTTKTELYCVFLILQKYIVCIKPFRFFNFARG